MVEFIEKILESHAIVMEFHIRKSVKVNPDILSSHLCRVVNLVMLAFAPDPRVQVPAGSDFFRLLSITQRKPRLPLFIYIHSQNTQFLFWK